MIRLLSAAAALAASGTLVAAAANAQAPQGYYVAVPAAQPAKTSLVTRSAAWRFQGGAFVAQQAPERPEVLCQLVADRTGGLSSFSAHGKEFDADQLAKCNARVARPMGQTAAIAK